MYSPPVGDMAYEHWSECMDNEIHKAHIENEIENLPQLYEMIDDGI